MANMFQMLEYEFEMHAEPVEARDQEGDGEAYGNAPAGGGAYGSTSASAAASPAYVPRPKESTWVASLNERSDQMAREIQAELRKVLPPRVRVEAEVQFFEGSIVAVGTVILLFLQPILIEAGRKALEKAFEEGFSRMIQFAVGRVMRRHMRGIPLIGPLEVEVTPSEANAPMSVAEEPAATSAVVAPQPAGAPQPARAIEPARPAGYSEYLMPFTVMNTALLVILILFLVVIQLGAP